MFTGLSASSHAVKEALNSSQLPVFGKLSTKGKRIIALKLSLMPKNKLVLSSSCPHEITVVSVCTVSVSIVLLPTAHACLKTTSHFHLPTLICHLSFICHLPLQLLYFSQYYIVLYSYPDNYQVPYLKARRSPSDCLWSYTSGILPSTGWHQQHPSEIP